MMKNIKRMSLVLLLVLSSVGCDQSTKYLASQYLAPSQPVSFLNDVFRLQYAENSGGFLSLGGSLSAEYRFIIFTVFVGLFLIGLFGYALFNAKQNVAGIVGLSLLIGGGASNLLDRIMNDGYVIDFANIGIGSLRTGIFNIADVLILVGAGILLVFAKNINPANS